MLEELWFVKWLNLKKYVFLFLFLIIFQVLISTDEGGNAIKVVVENTENNNLFETMKDLMINLAKINWENTK